ncbi:MAG: response regulator [Burkholderiales bacterium]|nr:response regulator [Burkholderiales bacterium]
MMRFNPLARLSSRVYLALGLASLGFTVVLMAILLGLVPDRDAMEMRRRVSLAETTALAATLALGDDDPAPVQAVLEFVRARNDGVRSAGLRRADGSLLAAVGEHPLEAPDSGVAAAQSPTDALRVPVLRDGEPWGALEIDYAPLRAGGVAGWLQLAEVRLGGFFLVAGFVAFYFYLRRMLRHLDPSRAVPQRVRHALDALTEGLLVLDAQGRIVLANQSLAAVLGLQAGALLGRHASRLPWTARDGVPIAREALPWECALATREVQRNAFVYVDGAGGRRSTFRSNCSPILGPDGRQQGVLVSLQDVTELESKEIALQAAKDEADQANRAKSVFLANMSHEIRTPMNAILGFTDVLRRGGLQRGADAARHLDIIHASGRHLLDLINDILDLSKVESGRMVVERVPCAPHAVAHEVVQALAVRAQDKGLALTLEAPQALPATIACDPARLRQILTNLVGNALKFTERGGVTLTLRMDGPAYCVDVADTGIGIAADQLDAVFDPFVQAEASTTRRFGGTGLGLTISRSLARAMGGDLTLASVPGEGSVFSCRIDAGDLDGVDWLPAERLREPPRAEQAAAGGARWAFPAACVLVVDDGDENRQLARIVLEEAGLVVQEAGDGQQAIDRLARETFDLVLMDIQMPVLDGLQATRRLRAAGCRLPILALTANAMKGYERELDEAGFDGHLVKPIDIDALLQALAERLGGRRVDHGAAGAAAAPGPASPAAQVMPAATATPAAAGMPAMAGAGEADRAPPDSPQPLAAAGPLVSRLAGHPRLARLAERFAEQLPERIEALRGALDAGDFDTLAALAHSLKGAGGSMGFDELFEPSRALEEAARAADGDAAALALRALQALGGRVEAGCVAAGEELVA